MIRFFSSLFLFYKHKFFVKDIIHETPEVTTFIVSGKNLSNFSHNLGKIVLIRFLDKKRFFKVHRSFVFLSKNNSEIRITLTGESLRDIAKDTRVLLYFDKAAFSNFQAKGKKVLYVASEMGILPIRFLIEKSVLKDNGLLLYSNKTIESIAFKQELDALAHENNFAIIHVLSSEKGYQGETGKIDKEKLLRLVPDLLEREVFISGPKMLLDEILPTLSNVGVKKESVYSCLAG